MDTNPRNRNSLRSRVVPYIPLIIALLLVAVFFLREWVAGDIQGRLLPATAVIVVPLIIALAVFVFREEGL